MRSHPPTLITLTRALLRDAALVERGSRVLVAVSGGPDSMALLHVLAHLRDKIGVDLVAHGVDHGLRPEAAAELDRAASFARDLAVPFDRTRVAVEPGGNLQARARDARYAALRAAAAHARCDRIATAHHMNDRAETFLIRLLRGSGARGLAVLPPRAGELIRPFSRADRATIDAHILRHAIPSSVDPSNRDARFLRARVRHELLPLLTELSPKIVAHLCALADELVQSPAPPFASLDLPRATRLALAALAARPSPRAEIRLPGGLVATLGRDHSRRTKPGDAADSDDNAPRNSVARAARIRWKHPPHDGRHHK